MITEKEIYNFIIKTSCDVASVYHRDPSKTGILLEYAKIERTKSENLNLTYSNLNFV